MAQELNANYTADVTLIAEFRKYRSGSASHGVFEINTVGKVGCYAHAIYYYIYPLGCNLPSSRLLIVEGDEHQQGIKYISI